MSDRSIVPFLDIAIDLLEQTWDPKAYMEPLVFALNEIQAMLKTYMYSNNLIRIEDIQYVLLIANYIAIGLAYPTQDIVQNRAYVIKALSKKIEDFFNGIEAIVREKLQFNQLDKIFKLPANVNMTSNTPNVKIDIVKKTVPIDTCKHALHPLDTERDGYKYECVICGRLFTEEEMKESLK